MALANHEAIALWMGIAAGGKNMTTDADRAGDGSDRVNAHSSSGKQNKSVNHIEDN